MTEAVLTIERVGARGDGVAHHEGRAVFLPFTAPGDVVRARLGRDGAATLIEMIARGPRRDPPCPHFGTCGGCSLQHLPDDVYVATKRDMVADALRHRGFDVAIVEAPIRVPPGTRRRARLALSRRAVGFHQRGSHRVVDMRACAVLDPALVALVQALRPLGLDATASMTLADTGIDLLLDLPALPDLVLLERLTAFAHQQDLARLSWHLADEASTPIVQLRPVRLTFNGTAVELPPDCFLQATTASEQAMRDLVLAGVGKSGRVADLYAGIGTFSFALARQARVQAVDANAAALAALRRANTAIATEVRDLERRPLTAAELDRLDAVVFDPPYAGAGPQARALAGSKVTRVVAVSCHPATFARDAKILVDGGFRMTRVVPIDQFLWSAEIELVAWFER